MSEITLMYFGVRRKGEVVCHVVPDANMPRLMRHLEAEAACGLVRINPRIPDRRPYVSEVCPKCMAWLRAEYPTWLPPDPVTPCDP